MNNYNFLQYEFQDRVGILSIHRPEKLNALNEQVLKELTLFFTDLKNKVEKNPLELRGLILTGSGEKAFIAGADIALMQKMNAQQALEFARLGQDLSSIIENFPTPIVAAVNGYALGGGCEMALACDFAVATKQALFGLPEVKLGLIPGFGGTQRLARLVGRHKARELIYTGRNIEAQEALQLGIILKIYENKQEMLEHIEQTFFAEVKKNSPLAIKLAKKALNTGVDLNMAQGLSKEREEFSDLFNSQDMQIGTTAFIQKTKPEFLGR